jgi:NADH-quinone oxidoreductase subunit E
VSALSPHILEEIRELPAKYPQPRSAVMPALDLAQEELGHLTPEAMSEVAAALELDPGYVEGVATFYTLFHLSPIGKHHFYICTNLSCSIRGSGDIVQHFKQATGVKEEDEISADRLFSYEEVECLGACEYAPMMRLDERYHYDLTQAKIDELIAERRGPHPPAAPATSPASGEVKPAAERRSPHPPAAPATSPASGEVKPAKRPRKKKADA